MNKENDILPYVGGILEIDGRLSCMLVIKQRMETRNNCLAFPFLKKAFIKSSYILVLKGFDKPYFDYSAQIIILNHEKQMHILLKTTKRC